jgi:hypothetical protein
MDEIDAMLEDVAKTVLTGLDTLAALDTDRDRQKDDFLSTHGTIREARNDALRRYVDLRPHERVRYSHGPVVGLTPSSRTTPGAFPHQLGEAR